jgi:cytochrome c oxidase subunit 2
MKVTLHNQDCSTNAEAVCITHRSEGSERRWQQHLLYLCGCLAVLCFTACGEGNQSALDPAGTQDDRWNRLWWFVFWICSAVFVIVMSAFIVALIRGRQNRQKLEVSSEVPEMEPEPGRESRARTVVIGAVVVTVLLLFAMLIFDFFTARRMLSFAATKEPLTIIITGHQWWWEVQYDDPQPSNLVKTANELHIPTGQPVRVKLLSSDVIHSFWFPNLQGKKDAIPGQETITWIEADKPGTYRGQCAEYCGYQHAHMAMLVIAETPEEYDAWLTSQRQSASTPTTDEQKRGQQVFLSSTCVMCHTIQGTDAGSNYGPDLTHLASRHNIAAETLPNTRGSLGGWVANSQEIKPGNKMPPNPLNPDDLQALLSYLESLR